MDWIAVMAIAVLLPLGIVAAVGVVMYFMFREEEATAGGSRPEPSRAVEFERNIPCGRSEEADASESSPDAESN